MQKLEELSKELNKELKLQKDRELDNTIIEAQIKNKRKMLEDLTAEVVALEARKQSLESDFKKANSALMDDLSLRTSALKKKEIEAEAVRSQTLTVSSHLAEQAGKVSQKLQELIAREQVVELKLNKIKALAAELSK